MQKFILFFTILLLTFSCQSHKLGRIAQISKDDLFPRWLIGNGYHTEQTSGITYIGSNNKDEKFFLLVDDIGKIHRMKITNDTSFSFTSICFSEEVLWYFHDFPKLDFEEITYDKYTGDVYLSIEGNEDNYNDFLASIKSLLLIMILLIIPLKKLGNSIFYLNQNFINILNGILVSRA